MKIRPLRNSDAAAVTQLAERCFEDSIRPFYTEEGCLLFHTYVLPVQILERSSSGALILVAEEEKEITGVVELREKNHISMLFVSPEFQQCGIGRKLLERIWKLAVKLDSGLSGLTTFAAPGAVEAYRHWGFTADGPETVESGVRYTPMSIKKGVFHG